MREWVLDPAAFDLVRAAPALIDVVVAGLRANPPRRTDCVRAAAPSPPELARRPA